MWNWFSSLSLPLAFSLSSFSFPLLTSFSSLYPTFVV